MNESHKCEKASPGATEDSVVSNRYLNSSAVKAHALRCSRRLRAGHFTRVSKEFVQDVQAEAERQIKALAAAHQPAIHDIVEPEGDEFPNFITGDFVKQAKSVLNQLIPRIIQSKVQRHPTLGSTLKK